MKTSQRVWPGRIAALLLIGLLALGAWTQKNGGFDESRQATAAKNTLSTLEVMVSASPP